MPELMLALSMTLIYLVIALLFFGVGLLIILLERYGGVWRAALLAFIRRNPE